MGMAASQARFLGLTARKNNVEFEGQQINQQRTALSNQSASYYSQLLGMEVPIPPSVDDFTKTVYTFQDGALTNQITAMISQGSGNYKVSYLRQWVDDFSVIAATTSIVNGGQSGPWMVGPDKLRNLGDISGITATSGGYQINGISIYPQGSEDYLDNDGNSYTAQVYSGGGTNYYKINNAGEEYWYVNASDNPDDIVPLEGEVPEYVSSSGSGTYEGQDEYLSSLSTDQLQKLKLEEEAYLDLLKQKYGDDDYLVRYVKNTTTEEWVPYFYKSKDLKSAIYDEHSNSKSNIHCYKIGSETKAEEVKAVDNCRIEQDSSGRYINISIPDGTGNLVTYALTTETATDQEKYQDAMNQYEYEKYQYDQAIQEINAKIEIVQSEDKALELRLKQLDTEQKAISTELEAVGQVIQKNTESSFKTFG